MRDRNENSSSGQKWEEKKTLQSYKWTKMGTQPGKKVDKKDRLADTRTWGRFNGQIIISKVDKKRRTDWTTVR